MQPGLAVRPNVLQDLQKDLNDGGFFMKGLKHTYLGV